MRSFRPDYYDDFKCIGGSCTHTCCAGWEIGVDSETLRIYRDFPDIMSHIKDSCIITEGPEERCPFLLENGLCDLIIKYGEDILCDICADHPRFRNYEDGIEYVGLGLCCEAACDLILDRKEKFSLVPKTELPYGIDLISDIEGKISPVIGGLAEDDMSSTGRAKFFLTFEILDGKWEKLLNDLIMEPVSANDRDNYIDSYPVQFKNLMIYFLYRHKGNRNYAVQSCRMIAEVCVRSGIGLKEISRMYSAEVEYSDINTEIMENIGKE